MPLSVDKHCEMITAHIRDRNTMIMDSFKLFVQMFSALVGGAVIVRLQYPGPAESFAYPAVGIGLLIYVISLVMIWENIRSWYQYRIKLSNEAGRRRGRLIVPLPKLWRAIWIELVMTVLMTVSLAAFWYFNPLTWPLATSQIPNV